MHKPIVKKKHVTVKVCYYLIASKPLIGSVVSLLENNLIPQLAQFQISTSLAKLEMHLMHVGSAYTARPYFTKLRILL